MTHNSFYRLKYIYIIHKRNPESHYSPNKPEYIRYSIAFITTILIFYGNK